MPDRLPAPHGGTGLAGMVEQRLVQRSARQADPFERQLRGDHLLAAHEPQMRNPVAAELPGIEAELPADRPAPRRSKTRRRFYGPDRCRALDQRHLPPRLGKARRSSSTGQPAAGDEDRAHFNRLML